MYYIVDIIDGKMDIDYDTLINGIGLIGGLKAAVKLKDCPVRQNWQLIDESQFESIKVEQELQ